MMDANGEGSRVIQVNLGERHEVVFNVKTLTPVPPIVPN
jgi:hypothetical protein